MTKRSLFGGVVALAIACLLGSITNAHEHERTHKGLTLAAYRLLGDYSDMLARELNRVGPTSVFAELAQGVIDEDECVEDDGTGSGRDWGMHPNWNSHFFEPKSRLMRIGAASLPPCRQGPFSGFEQVEAPVRAETLWNWAKQDYAAGNYRSAYRILGRVLHLLQDMTSPAHSHNDPHGKISKFSNFQGCASQDIDDFETWGWCPDELGSSFPDANHRHIMDYVNVDTGARSDRLNATLQRLFNSAPQGGPGSLDVVRPRSGEPNNTGYAFVRRLAERVYDFTTFHAKLRDTSPFTDVQETSELTRMLLGSTGDDCGAFTIDQGLCEIVGGFQIASGNIFDNDGPQDIGFSFGECRRTEGPADATEEWWMMEGPSGDECKRIPIIGPLGNVTGYTVEGFVFIENSGGEGANSLGDPHRFRPQRWGCSSADAQFCRDNLAGNGDRSKPWFRQLYGTTLNQADNVLPCPGTFTGSQAPCPGAGEKKATLRIYGDVLYTAAVAYSAGLIERFIDEVNRPIADAGGPYVGEACQLIDLDGSRSRDQQANGSIVKYEWDATSDGTYDKTATSARTDLFYSDPFTGQLTLRVTDNDGFTGLDTASVQITPDVTPPNLSNMTVAPGRMWPPNHKMVEVVVDTNVEDACGTTTCKIVAVASNEPAGAAGSGNTSPDWEITGDLTVKLRSERSGSGDGRVYTITVECEDAAGNSTTRSIAVTVPHSEGSGDVPSSTLCTFSFNPGDVEVSASGGDRTIDVTPSPAACSWQPHTNDPWITVAAPQTRTGAARLTLSLAANPAAPPRTGQVSIGGYTFKVKQQRRQFQWTLDADRLTDITVWRPQSGTWYVKKSQGAPTAIQWGSSLMNDVPVPGDYDGDGVGDPAVWRPADGTWFVLRSSTQYTTWLAIAWGTVGDVPVPGDYDADGKTDLAVWRPDSGAWFVLKSSLAYDTRSALTMTWGAGSLGDVAVPADYDGDGATDLAVWRPSSGTWFVKTSTTSFKSFMAVDWGSGASGDRPVVGDYDGDGTADLAVWRQSTGEWYMLQSKPGFAARRWTSVAWGAASTADIPVLGDYDGDGRADPAVWRPGDGRWYVLSSQAGFTHASARIVDWGGGWMNDVPIPNR